MKLNSKAVILAAALVFFLKLAGFCQEINMGKIDSLFTLMQEKDKFMGSIAIAQNGKVLYSRAIGKDDVEAKKASTTESKYRIGSISKMFTAAMVLKAVEADKISLSQTIDKYFPSVKNAPKITVANLLNHHSGIHNFTDDSVYTTYNTVAKKRGEIIDIIVKGPSDFEPGTRAAYSNSNYVLLSILLEKLYNESYADLVKKQIATPLQLSNTYVGSRIRPENNEALSYSFGTSWDRETETDMSIPIGAGAIVSTPVDLTKFVTGLFSGKMINEKSLAQMKRLQDNFGMGLFIMPFYEKAGYGHTGGIDGFSSVLSFFPDDQLAIAITSNGSTYDNNSILIAALSSFYNKPYVLPTFATVELSAADLDKYLGVYASATFPLKISISKKDKSLMAQATGQSAFPLEATGENVFEFSNAGIKLEFKPAVKQMILNQGGRSFTLTRE